MMTDKHNILQENLCIREMLTVIKGHLSKSRKPYVTSGRQSDCLVYVTSGSCSYRFDDGTQLLATQGDVLYLPCQSVYAMSIQSEEYHVIFCNFFFDASPCRSAIFSGQSLQGMDILFSKLYHLYRSTEKSKYTACMSVLYSIYSGLQQTSAQAYLSNSKKEMIADAKRIMDEGFGNSTLDIPSLAAQMGISEVYFRKLFKNQYGTSPLKYLNALRIKHAVSLMQHPFLSLEECAKQSGFASLPYFCRVFKRDLGISPGKYRKTL